MRIILTLKDGKQDDNDEEEEGDVEDDPPDFGVISIWRLQLIANAATGADAFVQVEYEALRTNCTCLVNFFFQIHTNKQ